MITPIIICLSIECIVLVPDIAIKSSWIPQKQHSIVPLYMCVSDIFSVLDCDFTLHHCWWLFRPLKNYFVSHHQAVKNMMSAWTFHDQFSHFSKHEFINQQKLLFLAYCITGSISFNLISNLPIFFTNFNLFFIKNVLSFPQIMIFMMRAVMRNNFFFFWVA